tara:strand:- start:531 stop:782 length:252 start_codon:yes stop_codon:yes gene_type:complete
LKAHRAAHRIATFPARDAQFFAHKLEQKVAIKKPTATSMSNLLRNLLRRNLRNMSATSSGSVTSNRPDNWQPRVKHPDATADH